MTLLFIDTNIPLPLRPPFQDSEGRTGRAGEGRAEESARAGDVHILWGCR